MRLSDWPIMVHLSIPEVGCVYPIDHDEVAPTLCGMSLSVSDPSVGHNGRTMFEAGSFGELAGAIVAHARDQHGIEIERDGVWYRSFTPDGKLWAESSSVDDFTAQDLDGMEGEELEHWTAHNAKMGELRYQRVQVYTVAFAEEWKPELPAQTEPESECVYDVWGADFGVQAGAQCLNLDPAHHVIHQSGRVLDANA